MTDFLGGSTGKFSLMGRTDRTNQLGFISLADGKNNAYVGLYAGASRPQAGTNNTFVGTYAGSNASSESSVFLGTATGRRATRIKESTFIGYKAGEVSERVESSVSIGAFAGRKMVRANCNTLLGYQAGAELTSGSRNTVLGSYAAFSQYNAYDNVCIGHRSGYKNTVGSNNCYIGTNSGFAAYQGYDNVALGVKSGEGLTSGKKNVLVGYSAGSNISGASNCIAIGTQAMQFFNMGDTNTCIGTQAARSFTGVNNTILGGYSTSNASGNYNTIVGSRSMNRRTGDRVALSNCVILGENIQFDIPVRRVTLYPKDMDVIPDAQLENPDALTSILFDTPSRTFAALNLVPVGDPMLVKERYISLGSLTEPVVFDTSYAGTYTMKWGSHVTEDDVLLEPIPVMLTIDVPSAAQDIRVTLVSYGDLVDSWTVPSAPSLEIFVSQEFNPAQIRITVGNDIDETYSNVFLPGVAVTVDRVADYGEDTIILFASTNAEFLVPGMEIQINGSVIDALNTVWRIAAIGPPETGGLIPVSLNITGVEGISGTDLGTGISVLMSRAVTRPAFGDVVDKSLAISEPYFAGMLYGKLTSPQVYVDGSGDIPEGVYDITVTNAELGEFGVNVGAVPDEQDVFVGNMSIGTFEPLIVGFEITTSADISGPSYTDGHIQSGEGSQEQMDADLELGYLNFVGNEFATYELGSGTTTVNISGAFDIPLSGDIDCGFRWMDHYDVKCVKDETAIGVFITSTNDDIITNVLQFSTAVQLSGSIAATEFPLDVSDLLTTPNPRMTVAIEHDTVTQNLKFTITLQGGTRFGSDYIPQGIPKIAKILVGYVPTPETLGTTVVYYATAATKLSAVSITTNTQNVENTLIDNYTVVYSQRSDTGLQDSTNVGPTAFDGHLHRGDVGSQESLDQDIRENKLTFAAGGYSAADYKVGSLSTTLQTSVTFEWAPVDFGVEWLDSYKLTCEARADGFSLELYHLITQKILVSFTPEELYGRVRASIVQFDENDVQIPLVYPVDIVQLDPQSVKIDIDHKIKAKDLTVTITLFGTVDKVVYIFVLADAPSVNRYSTVLSYVAYGSIIAKDITIVQSNYQAYPTFKDCIFVGSNFTVGGDVAIVDKERDNVFIAAIGSTRLFRGRTEDFVFFSNVVTANTLNLKGGSGDEPTLTIQGNQLVNGNVDITGTLDVGLATTLGATLNVTDAVAFGDTLDVTGSVTFQNACDIFGSTVVHDSLQVTGSVSFGSSFEVDGSVMMGDSLEVTGAVHLKDTLHVDDAVTFYTNCTVTGDVSIGDTLSVTGTSSFTNAMHLFDTLDVDRNTTINGTLDVDGAVNFNNTLSVDNALTSGSLNTGALDAGSTTLDSLNVSGGANLASLDVNGAATIDGTLTMNDDINVPGNFNDVVVGNISVRGLDSTLDTLNEDVDALTTRVTDAETDITDNYNSLNSSKLNTSGGTITGALTVSGDVNVGRIISNDTTTTSDTTVAVYTTSGRIARSSQSWALQSQLNNYLSKSGGTMTGDLVIPGGSGQLVLNTSGSGTPAVVTDSGNRLCKSSSSIRYKRDVIPMSANLLWKVEPVFFYYKTATRRSGGFIAEQLDDIGFREGVFYEDGQPEALLPDGILALAIAGIKELRAEVETLKMQIKNLLDR